MKRPALATLVRPPTVARAAAAAFGCWAALTLALPQFSVARTQSGQWESPGPVLLLGVVSGLTYSLLAVGLLLIYRTNRVINFAHGQMGAFAAAFFGIAVVQWHIPYWIAFVLALLVGAMVAALVETVVVRRLRNAPLVMSVVATLGVGQFLVLFAAVINSQASAGAVFPVPSLVPEFNFGALLVTRAYTAMLLLSPIVILVLALFLKFSRHGLGLRASADNPQSALMTGISTSRMSSIAWGMGGVLSAFAAILTQPTKGFGAAGDSFGPSLLLIALTGGVLARMQSIPRAVGAGVAIGVLEQLLLWNFADGSLVQVALFMVLLVVVIVQKQHVGRTEEKGAWVAVQPPPPLPKIVRDHPLVRAMTPAAWITAALAFAALPILMSNATAIKTTATFAFIVVGLSVGVVTGLGGQLSLGQFAIAAIGAVAALEVLQRTNNVIEAFIYGGLAGAVTGVLVGLPALRAKGLLLTVTTLSFALVVPNYLLPKSWLLGVGKETTRPTIGGTEVEIGLQYYYVGLATLGAALILARNIRRSGIGRRLIAVRDNEDAARAFTVNASVVKVQGFALGGFIAGLGGAMYAHSLSLLGPTSFPTSASIDVVVMTIVGGLGMLSGPLLGAALVRGSTYLPLDAAGLAASSFGLLLIIMYLPGGLATLVLGARDRLAHWIVGAAPSADDGSVDELLAAPPRQIVCPVPRSRNSRRADRPILEATGLTKSFGGIRAVRGVDIAVMPGETLGLIGPNGAGKTTTFELLAGFTQADAGVVTYGQRDISWLGPEARGRLGLIRSFQDAGLFPTLTVLECVEVALERQSPTRLLPAIAGLRTQDTRKTRYALELVDWMGLSRYAEVSIRELSTGTRRIAEILCLVAMQPEVLLLDEPSSGVAQRETEALGTLLRQIKEELDLTLMIIEHDIPLIMGLSDRIICMADGEIIAQGAPDAVKTDPKVVEAYLGGSVAAIERSDATVPTSPNADPEES